MSVLIFFSKQQRRAAKIIQVYHRIVEKASAVINGTAKNRMELLRKMNDNFGQDNNNDEQEVNEQPSSLDRTHLTPEIHCCGCEDDYVTT